MWIYIACGAILAVILGAVIYTAKRNGEIMQNGVETTAVVSRVKETDSTDSDGMVTTSYTFYVTYQTANGQTAEARLASGKSVDNRIFGKAWDSDLSEGVSVRIKYLPDKPNYAIRIMDGE